MIVLRTSPFRQGGRIVTEGPERAPRHISGDGRGTTGVDARGPFQTLATGLAAAPQYRRTGRLPPTRDRCRGGPTRRGKKQVLAAPSTGVGFSRAYSAVTRDNRPSEAGAGASVWRRHTSALVRPASRSRSPPMICLSVNFDRFIVQSIRQARLQPRIEEKAGHDTARPARDALSARGAQAERRSLTRDPDRRSPHVPRSCLRRAARCRGYDRTGAAPGVSAACRRGSAARRRPCGGPARRERGQASGRRRPRSRGAS